MSRMLYLECASGISGDMFVAAMLDLGASEEKLRAALASLPIDGFDVAISRVSKAGLDACDFDVRLDAAHENHDHDMQYLHGHEPGGHTEHNYQHPHAHIHDRKHEHETEHAHSAVAACEAEPELATAQESAYPYACDHEHGRNHNHAALHQHAAHTHHHEHRGMPEITAIIDAADIAPSARELAKRIFGFVARAEAKAHGVPIDQVRFHEVGAIDSIVDVVSAAVCFDDLGFTDVVVESMREGRGTVRCQHGVLPVPVPAVANISAEAGIPLSIVDVEGELVTPTGAAIAAAIRTQSTLPAKFTVHAMGLGAGKREYSRPSLLRAMVIESQGKPLGETEPLGIPHLWKLETEMDDCTGEALGFLLDELYAAGAREAHYLPVFMKKNRPGYQVQVLCSEQDIPSLESVLFAHSTTIGIRRQPVWRTALARESRQVETPFGSVRAKLVTLPNGARRAYPEHDSVTAIARTAGVGYQDASQVALAAIAALNWGEA